MSKGTKISIFALAAFLFFVFSFAVFTTDTWAAGDPAKGKKVFMTNCATCHGDKGDGKGAAAAALNPKPRNFTDPKEMQGIDDARLHKSITQGRPGTAMVGFGNNLKPTEIDDVVAYIKTLAKK